MTSKELSLHKNYHFRKEGKQSKLERIHLFELMILASK